MTRTRLWTTALLLTASTGLFTGCVSQESQDNLRTINRSLQEQIIDLQDQIEGLKVALAQRDRDLAAMRAREAAGEDVMSENSRLRTQVATLQTQLASLEQQLAEAISQQGQITIVDGPLPQELRDALGDLAAANPDLMVFDEQRGMIRLRSDLTFSLGSATVNDNAKAALTRLAGVLNSADAKPFDIMVVGHTDSVPVTSAAGRQQHIDNRGLSSNRGDAVARVLTGSGVSASRIMSGGRGATQPIAQNDARRGNQANRRVEIFIVKAANPGGVGPAPAPEGDGDETTTGRTTAPRPGVVEDRPVVEDPGAFK
ncbi:MAG: OmpA family protein [Planctomycetota bacterium]